MNAADLADPAPRLLDAAGRRLVAAPFLASPNFDARPPGADISLLVVHAIALPPEQFGGGYIDQLFCNRLDAQAHPYFEEIAGLRVSAHACIFRDGSVHQYVDFDARGWHAVISNYCWRENCNDFSIGIELEGGDHCGYTDAQYQQLAVVARALMQQYPRITAAGIVGHSDIAPGRKTDPGPHFDWTRLHYAVEFGP